MPTMLDHHVDQIVAALEGLSRLMMQPEALQLVSTHGAIERLHGALPLLGNVNTAFAYLCERDRAGALVGANHPVEYLTQRLGMSRAAAFDLLAHAKTLFGEPEVPQVPEPPEAEDGQELSEEALRQQEEERRRQEEERRRREEKARKAKERARKAAEQKAATEEKKRIINNALRSLNEHADPGRDEIYALAMEAAAEMTPESLRKMVTEMVRKANEAGRDLSGEKDPFAAFKKRSLTFSEPDADGGSWGRMYMDAASRALFEAAVAAGDGAGSNLPDGCEDTRTKQQRRFDQMLEIVRRYSQDKTRRQGGVGTVVVTATLEDLLNADSDTVFPTNTSVGLTALDIVRLGLAGDSFLLQLDSVTGVPLSAGRQRLATVEQRILLLAMQSVCAWNGCSKVGVELEAHHLESYLQGGLTSLDNLVLLCREHHRCMNDFRDGKFGKGFLEKDPNTGEVLFYPADGGPPTCTTTREYRNSPGQRTAEKARSRHFGSPPRERDPVLFPVGETVDAPPF